MASSASSPDGIMGEGRGTEKMDVDSGTDERLQTLEESGGQLIPGIADEITVNHISTKLAWTELSGLSVLNSRWKQAFVNQLLYAARVHSQSLQTVFLHNHITKRSIHETVALYSLKHDRCYELPSIPGIGRGIPEFSSSISLKGIVYVLGGKLDGSDHARKDVYAYDVLTARAWNQCASMKSERLRFACGVLGDKIYVFGGLSCNEDVPGCSGHLVRGCEVYDPETDAWHSIKPLWYLRSDHRVEAFGEELFVYDGYPGNCPIMPEYAEHRLPVEIYRPIRDEWQVKDPLPKFDISDRFVFMAEGKFYQMTWREIRVLDSDANEWKPLHTHDFGEVISDSFFKDSSLFINEPTWAVVFIEEELLLGAWKAGRDPDGVDTAEAVLLRSNGFRNATEELVWEFPEDFSLKDWNHLRTICLTTRPVRV